MGLKLLCSLNGFLGYLKIGNGFFRKGFLKMAKKKKATKKKATEKKGVKEEVVKKKKKLRKIRVASGPTTRTRMGNPREAKCSRTLRGNNLYLRSP